MNKKTLILTLFLVIASIFTFVPLAYSWFEKTEESTIVIETGEFQIIIIASFNGNVITTNSQYYDQEKKVIILNASNPASPNYIGRFKVTLRVSANIPSRLRVKIQDEWKLVRTYREDGFVIEEALSHRDDELNPANPTYRYNLSYASKNDLSSGFMYYNHLIEKNQNYIINFITSGNPKAVKNTITYYEECFVYFDLIVEMVQANRFSEIWGIPYNFFN